MTRTPVHSAPEGSRDALKALEAQFGKVLSIHGAMAHSPAVLQTYVEIPSVLADQGALDKRDREVVALAVANVDECDHCQTAHTLGGKAAGLTEQETLAICRGQVEDAKTAALVVPVRQQAGNVGHVQDSTWAAVADSFPRLRPSSRPTEALGPSLSGATARTCLPVPVPDLQHRSAVGRARPVGAA